MGLESGTGRVLSFADIYKHIQTLRETMAAFRAFNAAKRQCQGNAAELDAVNSSAEAVETAAEPLMNLALDLRCSQCRVQRGVQSFAKMIDHPSGPGYIPKMHQCVDILVWQFTVLGARVFPLAAALVVE